MEKDRLMRDAIYFQELKKQRASFSIDKEIHEEWLVEHPKSNKSLSMVADMTKKIAEIDSLLIKEPPSPELPPHQPLIKVSGVLEEIEILFARGFFTDREYEPEEFDRKEKNRLWGSVILAAVGESAASAVHSQDDIREADAYDFVKGKVNGMHFHGWLGRTTAKPGDYIELAAVEKQGYYEVYALALPKLKVVSVLPRCYQGGYSKASTDLKYGVYLPFGMAAVVAVVGAVTPGIHFGEAYVMLVCGSAALMTVYIAIASPIFYLQKLKKPNPTNSMAQKIFTALEMQDPEKINLKKITKEKIKSSAQSNVQDRIMPDCKCWYDYYYYY
ncbi:TPA: hypothetical protein JD264_09740 [Serratia fonticola]|nr:hypothetical protein [Serratia fonticola]